MKTKTIKVGLLGFGTIGSGVVKILAQSAETIRKRLGASIEIVKIADLDIKTDRGVTVARGVLTKDANEALCHPDIDVVIELIGGYEPARTFILKAIENGKHVVTANKALLAKHGDEIFAALEKKRLSIGFEGSVAGAIPIIRSIRESFVANQFTAIEGIVNGTANYILSKMTDGNCDFKKALREAQAKGYAEADPTFDIEGIDSAHKIAILTRLAYGARIDYEDIHVEGISKITPEEVQCAKDFGYRIKLLAISKFDGQSLDVRVHPAMIPESHPMANINGVLNAVRVCDNFMVENILVGHGAGSLPTGSAVVGDVVEVARNILSGARNRVPSQSFQIANVKPIPLKDISEIDAEYFLHFRVLDNPGVLSRISGVLGNHSISIASVIQRGRDQNGKGVPLIMMTHTAREKNIQDALSEIDRLDCVCEKTVLLRVER
ncbi:MAG: homoserine dehydrogenase [Nitrospinae bacterium]|nr:homoserine dehydrogenase [Nitrospinota bacterium]